MEDGVLSIVTDAPELVEKIRKKLGIECSVKEVKQNSKFTILNL